MKREYTNITRKAYITKKEAAEKDDDDEEDQEA
jgi:hypothetical protein